MYRFGIEIPDCVIAVGNNPQDQKIRELQDRLLELNERAQVIQASADSEGRPLTDDEDKELHSIFNEFDSVEEEIGRRQHILNQTKKLQTPGQRKTTAEDPASPEIPDPQNAIDDPPRQPQSQQRKKYPSIVMHEDRGKWGFRGLGEFAQCVRNAQRQGGYVDPRLVMNAPTTYSQESVGADGGFLVPPDFRTEIWTKVNGEDSLLGRTDQQTTTKHTMTWPSDEDTPWAASGGIQAYWESEASQLSQSKIALETRTIRLNKLTALIPVTEELLEDAPGLDSYLRRKVSQKFDYKITDKIVRGTGGGEPLGILNAPSLVSVAKETGQSSDTIVAANIDKMWARMYAPCRRNAVWLINQDIEPQLSSMSYDIGVAGVPVYLPPGGLSAAPYGTLKGRPVIPTQAADTLGDKGDIMLVDFSQYLTAVRTGNIKIDVSMHLFFDYDLTAYRFILRMTGMPWWKTYITPANSTNTLSWAVTLDERA